MGQGRQVGNIPGKLVGNLLQVLRLGHLVNQAHAQGLFRVYQATGQQDVQGVALAHQVDQSPHLPVADADAQARRRNSQPAILSGDAQVGGYRQFAATAGGETPDHGNGRGGHGSQSVQKAVHRIVIYLALGRVGTELIKIGDVSAGGKGCVARPGDYHYSNVPVTVQFVQPICQFAPHLIIDGIPLAGPVDGKGYDG